MATTYQNEIRTVFEAPSLALRNISARYHAWAETRRRINRVQAELHAYTDRQLQDLGLCRSDIPEVARGTFRRS